MRNWILIIASLGLVLSCQTKKEKNIHENTKTIDSTFHFTIKNAIDKIDSKTGTMTRQYTTGIQSAHFVFTAIELMKIQSLYFEKRLDTLPNDYTPICPVDILPTFDEEFFVNFNGKQKRFVYNGDFQCLDDNSKNVIVNMGIFKEYIINILGEKEEVKNLKYSDLEFF